MRIPRFVTAAGYGVLAAVAGLAAAELAAAILRPEASPLIAVGGAVIDATPTPVKEYAVRTFGTADKPILLWTIRAALLGAAATVGIVAARRRRLGLVLAAALGLAGAAAALARPAARPADAIPSLAGAAVSVAVLAYLTRPAAARAARPTARGAGC
ncbi:hypothetical protein [Phytohabitans houttuyneae]|uniref:Oxidoreductase n=1 Tax=Phytohabitans houttuyneae TaxID=1076126 RepID=A0A6V8KFF5_9ACTN|nr:hypothetical protein [Phytohabitans houttuyneae]GFJ82180.1 hypothetical protein Phou_063600 [Phytohabitans houttuyneae]